MNFLGVCRSIKCLTTRMYWQVVRVRRKTFVIRARKKVSHFGWTFSLSIHFPYLSLSVQNELLEFFNEFSSLIITLVNRIWYEFGVEHVCIMLNQQRRPCKISSWHWSRYTHSNGLEVVGGRWETHLIKQKSEIRSSSAFKVKYLMCLHVLLSHIVRADKYSFWHLLQCTRSEILDPSPFLSFTLSLSLFLCFAFLR